MSIKIGDEVRVTDKSNGYYNSVGHVTETMLDEALVDFHDGLHMWYSVADLTREPTREQRQADEIAVLKARVAALEGALKPFAALMPDWYGRRDDDASEFEEYFNAVVDWELVEGCYDNAFDTLNKK